MLETHSITKEMSLDERKKKLDYNTKTTRQMILTIEIIYEIQAFKIQFVVE